MNMPHTLTLLLVVSLLLQPIVPLMASSPAERTRPVEAAQPVAAPVTAPIVAPTGAEVVAQKPVAYEVYLPIRYKSGEEAAPQPPAPVVSPHEALQTASAANGVLFIENVGQFDPQARFLVRGGSGNLFLADDALWLTVLEQPQESLTPTLTVDAQQVRDKDQVRRGVNLKLSFLGANPKPRLEPFNRLDTNVSYFIGDDPAKWQADVPVWGGVRYVDLYPGIDLELTNEQGQLQQRLVVRDNAQLNQVRLKVDGAQTVATRRVGNRSVLQLATTIGDFDLPLFEVTGLDSNGNLDAPAIQENVVAAPFANAPLRAPGLQSLYRSGLLAPAAITNTADLLYSTYLGGNGADAAYGIAVDKYGAIYVAGCTTSADFITTTGSYTVGYGGALPPTWPDCGDAFVTKINTTGVITVAYSTYLGTDHADVAYGIAVNANGEAYVTGLTFGTDFPMVNPYTTSVGSGAVFVTQFNMTGTALLYSTYLGLGIGRSIAVEANGNAAVVGQTNSKDFPTTPSAYARSVSNAGNYNPPHDDVFVAQINPSQSGNASLLYSTFLGGGMHDCQISHHTHSCAVAVDNSGKIYVAGRTNSSNFPMKMAYQSIFRGGGVPSSDAFMAKIDPAQWGVLSLVYSTYLGGTDEECIGDCAIAVDAQGMAYVSGSTRSTNFPTTTLAMQKTFGGSIDAFVAKIDATKSQTASLVYSTYLGGNGWDSGVGAAIAVDSAGRAYVTGDTTSTNFPTTTAAYQTTFTGGRCVNDTRDCYDAFVATLNPAGSGLEYATYLGGTGDDIPHGVVANAIGIYIAGGTTSGNFPTTDGGIQTGFRGIIDAFVTVLQPAALLNSMVRTLSCPLCASFNSRNHRGGPIDTLSGNYTYQKPDQSIPVLGGSLAFERSYSADTRSLFTRTLGYGWTHNQEIRLAFPTDPGGVAGQVLLQAPGGSQLPFFDLGNGRYQPYSGVTASMSRITATGGITTYVVTATNQTVYTFNATGLVTQSVNPAGNIISYTYYLTGPLQSVQSYGRSLRFYYDTQNRLKQVLDPINRATQFIYDANGDLANVVDTRNLTWTYQYSGTTHLLSRVLDPELKTVERTVFDGQGRAIQQYNGQDELIVKLEFGSGGVITATDGLTRTAVDRYGRGTWLGGTDSASQAITRTYDANFKPTYVADPNGHGPQIKWSANGSNLERVVDAGGYTTTMQYDGLNNPTLITDTRGFTTAYEYSGSLLTRTIDALGNTTIYTYGLNNLLIAQQDPLGRVTRYEYNLFGQRTVMTDALINVTRFDYDAVGRLITTTDAIGRITVNAYDPADHLIAVTNNYTTASAQQNLSNTWNLITRYGYDGFGRQIAVTDTLNHTTRNYYDGAGRLISVTANFTTAGGVDPNVYNLKTWYGFDAVGNQIAVTDTLLHVTRTEYDNLNRPVTVTQNYKGVFNPAKTDEDVQRITHYDPAGNVIEQIDPPNATGERRVTRNWYDSLNRVISTTVNYNPQSGADPTTYNLTTWYEYDPAGNQVAITDTQQHMTRNYYDQMGRLISTTVNYRAGFGPNYLNQYNLTTRYEYDRVGNRVTITDPLTSTVRYTYDKLNRVIATTNVSGTTYTQYDAIGNRVAVTDALTHTTIYTYNAVGQLVAEGNPVIGNITRYQYDALGRTIVVTDALTHTTRTFYDDAGRVVSTTNALTGTTVITYNALGQRVGFLNENGKPSYIEYDGLGRTVVMTDAMGSATRSEYDALGNRVRVIDGLTHPMTSTYDVANCLIRTQDAVGNTTRYGYDSLGNRVVMTDANGVATGYGYDALSRLSTVTESMTSTMGLDPNKYNLITRYGYDPIGNRIAMTDALTHTTVYTYDRLSRLIALTDPMTHTTRYQYDAVGNRTKVIDANNQTITYTYDVINRNTRIDYGTSMVTFEYDKIGNRKAMTDSLGVTRYVYDELNRLKQVTDPFTGTVQYRYDAVGNRTNLIYPDGKVVTYTFDAANRLTGTLSWDGQLTTYGFDKAGRLITTTLPNGVTTINAYDDANRLTRLTHRQNGLPLSEYAYRLDGLGNRVNATETQALNDFPVLDSLSFGNEVTVVDPAVYLITTTQPASVTTTLTSAQTAGSVDDYTTATNTPAVVAQALASGAPLFSDDFNDGQMSPAWTTRNGTWVEANGVLSQTSTGSADPRKAIVSNSGVSFPGNHQITARVRVDSWTDGGYARAGVGLFTNASGLGYNLLFRNDHSTIQFLDDYVAWGPSYTYTWSTGTWYWFALKMEEGMLYGKVWPDGASEPGTWPYTWARSGRTGYPALNGGSASALYGPGNATVSFDDVAVAPVSVSNLITTVITYTYDPLYRLTNAAYSGAYTYTFAYAYDKVGNRTVQTRTITNTQVTAYQYDNANRMTNAGGVTYTWDNNGNLVNDGQYAYSYDQANRLIQAQHGLDTRTSFYYDGDGLRMKQSTIPLSAPQGGGWSRTETYLVDRAAPLPVVTQVTTTLITYHLGDPTQTDSVAQYLYSLGTRPLAQNGGAWEYLLPDALGSVRQIVDANGNVTLAKSYEPYGTVLTSNGAASSIFAYAGEQLDTSGLVYLRARYMNPRLGIFLARDPWSGDHLRPGSMNGFNYAGGNPIIIVDPSGRCYPPVEFLRDLPVEQDLCVTLDQALFIYAHPNTPFLERSVAAAYIGGWAFSHSALLVGGSAIAGAKVVDVVKWGSRYLATREAERFVSEHPNAIAEAFDCVSGIWDSVQQMIQDETGSFGNQMTGYSGPPNGWENLKPDDLVPGWNGQPISDIFASQDYKMPSLLGGASPELQNTARYNYAVDYEGNIWLSRAGHHPDLVNGTNIYGAGEMYINSEGQIVLMDDWSGHYHPSGSQFFPYLKHLLQLLGINVENTQFKAYR